MTPARCEAWQPDSITFRLAPLPSSLPCPWIPEGDAPEEQVGGGYQFWCANRLWHASHSHH
eukprot:11566163-Alexandrium_andersonii.AAC.1